MKHLSITLALALAAACGRAQDLNQTIVGCVELGCPPSSTDKANDDCRVGDNSFPAVGLTRIPTQNKALESKVSWTKGFDISDATGEGRTFHSAFYLGSAPDLDLTDTGACAVLLHGVESAISFNSSSSSSNTAANQDTAQGTCSDAMGSACVAALLARAKKLLDGFGNDVPSSAEACAKLQADLDKNMDKECLSITKGSWSNLTSTALSGDGAPVAITGDKNSSSTCWPVLPKQYQLTLASEQRINGSMQADEAQTAQNAITPILTLFFPTGNQSVITEADASLSCVKVVGPPRASLDTANNGSGDHDSGVSRTNSVSRSVLFGSILATTVAAGWWA